MENIVQIGKQGVVMLPAQLCQKYGLQEGDDLSVLDLGGLFVFAAVDSKVSSLAREIERMRLEAGISIQELLERLRDQRERYFRENYADGGADRHL